MLMQHKCEDANPIKKKIENKKNKPNDITIMHLSDHVAGRNLHLTCLVTWIASQCF